VLYSENIIFWKQGDMMQTEFTRSEVETYLKVMKDDNDIVRFVDPLGANVLDVKGNGDACHALWGKCVRCENCTSLRALRTKGEAYKLEFLQGRTYWVCSRYMAVEGKDCVAEIVKDVTNDVMVDSDRSDEINVLLGSYKRMAVTDSLTGVYNRRFLDEDFLPSLLCCHDKGMTVNMGFLDMDCFKGINDRYGHVAGDQLLRDVAGFWKQRFDSREKGKERIVVRFGGDEILIVACGISQVQFREEFERYDKKMVKICQVGKEVRFPFDYSVGIASSEDLGSSWRWDDLFDIADHRMYIDKKCSQGNLLKNTLHAG
jgi:putative two-component system response regulator